MNQEMSSRPSAGRSEGDPRFSIAPHHNRLPAACRPGDKAAGARKIDAPPSERFGSGTRGWSKTGLSNPDQPVPQEVAI